LIRPRPSWVGVYCRFVRALLISAMVPVNLIDESLVPSPMMKVRLVVCDSVIVPLVV